MPTVPISPEVLPESGGVAAIPASPLGNAAAQGGALGEAIARGSQAIGAQIARMSDEVDITDARNAAIEAESTLRRAMYDERQLSGRSAVGATERLTSVYSDLLKKGSETLPTTGSRRRFHALLSDRRNVYLDGIAEHETEQRRQMRSDALRRSHEGAIEGIALDPRTVDSHTEAGLDAIYEYAALEHLDEAKTSDMEKAWLSSANATAISEAMVTDPELAETMLTERRTEIDPDVYSKLRAKLTPNINKQRAYVTFDAIRETFPGDLKAQLAKVREIDNADVRSIAETLLRGADADERRVEAEADEFERQSYFTALVAARGMANFDAGSEYLRRHVADDELFLSGLQELERAFQVAASGAQRPGTVLPEQQEARIDFLSTPTTELRQMTEAEFAQKTANLHPTHRAEATRIWKRAVEGKTDIQNSKEAALEAMDEAGVNLGKDQTRIFQAELHDRLKEIGRLEGLSTISFDRSVFEARKLLTRVPKGGFFTSDPRFREATTEWQRTFNAAARTGNFKAAAEASDDYTDSIPTWFQEQEGEKIDAAIDVVARRDGVDPASLRANRYSPLLVQAWFEAIAAATNEAELNRLLEED